MLTTSYKNAGAGAAGKAANLISSSELCGEFGFFEVKPGLERCRGVEDVAKMRFARVGCLI